MMSTRSLLERRGKRGTIQRIQDAASLPGRPQVSLSIAKLSAPADFLLQ